MEPCLSLFGNISMFSFFTSPAINRFLNNFSQPHKHFPLQLRLNKNKDNDMEWAIQSANITGAVINRIIITITTTMN